MTETTPYELIGGDAGVRELVERFYHHMDTLPEVRPIRDMHPRDLSGSIEKLYQFLSGWFGGPDLYVQQYGHPRLRARHLHVAIGDAERDQWMLCMDKALNEMSIDAELRSRLHKQFFDMASFVRNQAGQEPAFGVYSPGRQ